MKDLKEWWEETLGTTVNKTPAAEVEIEVEIDKKEKDSEEVEFAVPCLVRALTVSNLITHLLNTGSIKPDGDMEKLKAKLKVYIALLSKVVEEIE